MLIFRPLSVEELRALGTGEELTVQFAFGATPEFLRAFGLDDAADEDAERTLLYLAGLAALIRHGRRLVAVAEAPAQGLGNEYGVVSCTRGVRMADVSALFAEDPASQRLADVTRAALAHGVEDSWGHPAHEALLANADLLWFGPEEWAVLTGDTPDEVPTA